ncbi:MAG: SPFH domain-containing protein, partial [archaeon]
AIISTYLKPWEIGILQVRFGGNEGFQEKAYEGGRRYFIMPFRDTMHAVPVNLRYVAIRTELREIKNEGKEAKVKGGSHFEYVSGTGLEVPTADGSIVSSDVTVIYQVFKKTEYDSAKKLVHGGPLQLFGEAGTDPDNWDKLIRQTVEDRCKRALGSLKTDDYYNAPMREQKALLAKKLLNEGFTDEKGTHRKGWHELGVNIVAVLVKAYYYTPVIDHAVGQKNLQIQEKALNDAKERLSTNLAEVARVSAEGDALIETKRIEGESQSQVLISQAESYKNKQESQGDLLVKNAYAEKDKLKALALEGAQSSALYVARELAPLTGMLKGGVVTGINPFDLGDWINMLSGKKTTTNPEKKN